MAVAVEVEKGGDARLVADQLDQPAPAARDHQVDEFVRLEQRGDRTAVGGADGLYRVFGQARCSEAVAHAFDDHAGGMAAFAAAAQDHRIARLEAQGGGVGADIGARFVDHADHPDGHGDAFDGEAVGALEAGELAAHGIGQFGDFLERAGHALDAVLGQAEAVDEALGLAACDALHVLAIGFEQFAHPAAQRLGGFAQRVVLRLCAGGQQRARGLAGALAEVVDMDLRVGGLVGHRFSRMLASGREAPGISAARPRGRRLPAVYHAAGWKGHRRH